MTHAQVRALSIRQPFVELILRGTKTEEYRTRPTNFRGTVLLYASKTHDERMSALLRRHDLPPDLPRGVIVGRIDIAGCKPLRGGEEYAWELANPERFEEFPKFFGMPQPAFWFASLLSSSGSGTPNTLHSHRPD